ncbi:hypothetical protein Tco_1084568, partial [Tanacetum coccineum]
MRSHKDTNRILEELLRTLKPNSPVGEPEGSENYTEVTYDKEQYLSDHYTAHVTPPVSPSIPFLDVTPRQGENARRNKNGYHHNA